MRGELIVLALLMGVVTYAARAIPLLAPGLERLPRPALEYLRLVGPAVLAALAAVNLLLDRTPTRLSHVGIEWVAVGLCVALVAWRRNLLVGLVASSAIVALARATGFG